MSQLDDLSAGDSTPKLATASLKSLTLVVNRMAYAFKTPDGAVAPDMLQLASDGNLSLGGIPLVYATVGRSFLVQNADATNSTARLSAVSSVGNAIVSVQGGANSVDSGFTFRDQSAADIAKFRLDTVTGALKTDMRSGGVPVTRLRLNSSGELVLGDTSSIVGKLMILDGTPYTSGETTLYMQTTAVTTVPALMTGANGGSIQISGGSAHSTGGRGGQIDFNSTSWSAAPGTLIFRTGVLTNGTASPEVGRWYTNGYLGIGTSDFGADASLHVKAPNGVRSRIMSESVADIGGFTGRRTNGTYAAPTAIQNQDILAFFNSQGSYGGVGNYLTGSTIRMMATQNWTPTICGSGMLLSTVVNNTNAVINALWLDHNGYAGFNTLTPQSRFVVAASNGGSGYEIDPVSPVNIRTIDRSTGVYQSTIYRAQTHSWITGTAGTLQAMMLEFNGSLGVGTTTLSGGAGNTAIDSKVVFANTPNTTVLTIGDSGNGNPGIYAGLKIKNGIRNASSGGLNYFDITTRPADSGNGVATQADRTMIRLESSSTLTPRLLLQPTVGQTYFGDGTFSSGAKVVIQGVNGTQDPGLQVTGKDATVASADLIISKAGAVTSTAGLMPWLQFTSADASFAGNNAVAAGGAGNVFQIWNYVSNSWIQKFVVGPTNATLADDFAVTGNSNQALTVRGPAATSSNIVVQSNTNQGTANWITSKTDGSFHLGGFGGTEPAIGALAFNQNAQSIGLFAPNVTYLSNTYAHGGTARVLSIYNPDTSLNAQAHLFLGVGHTNLTNSAIGGVSFVLPNVGNTGAARVANMGAATELTSTTANPSGYLTFATKPPLGSTAIPRMFIRGSGNMVLGNSLIDTARLYIYNEGRNVDGVRVDMADASNGASSFVSMRNDTVGYAFSFLVGGNFAGAITHPSATTTSYGTGSDHRIKENIEPADDSGEIIDALEIVKFDMKADGYHVPHGFIAQKLNAVYPSAVIVGDTSLDVTPTSKIWSVDASKLVPVIAKEVQSLRKRAAAQDEIIAAQSSAIAELRGMVELLLQNNTK